MKHSNKFWNGKIAGVPGFILVLIQRIWELFLDELTTIITTNNIKKCGEKVRILRGFTYRYPNNIHIGDNVTIGSNVKFTSELPTGQVFIKNNVVIGRNSKIDFSGTLILEENVLLSEGVNIQTHDHSLDPRSMPIGKQILIKKNAWIGLDAMILSNVNVVGESSVVAAGSVVTKEVEPYSVYAGIPAKKVKNITNG